MRNPDLTFPLKIGHDETTFTIPARNYLSTLELASAPAMERPKEAVLNVLRKPGGFTPLAEVVRAGERVVVLVNDITRVVRTEVFLPPILDELNRAGVPDENIVAMIAPGTHRLSTEEEKRNIVGAEAFQRIRVLDHDCHDDTNLVDLGTTSRGTPVLLNKRVLEADRIVTTGEITHHFAAGYTGGRKSILPGVAAFESVNANHRMMQDERAEPGRLAGNPLHEDLMEAANLVKVDFTLNVVLNENRQFVAMLAGHHRQVLERGRQVADATFGATVDGLADVVVASCGGYPKDINLYQSQKTLENAVRAVKPGGTIVLVAECAEGHGSEKFYQHMVSHKTLQEVEEAARANWAIGIHKAFFFARLLKKADIVLTSRMDPRIVRDLFLVPAASPEEALRFVREKHGND
ncbi:MAG: nickel-dependent lactate racemase, partial [Chloroflexi bacterium]|nr:nickel-dependent lactate racemase [Chloroflexota bacterium]